MVVVVVEVVDVVDVVVVVGIYSRHIRGTLFGLLLIYGKHGIGTTLNSVVDVVVVVVVGLSVAVLP